MTSMRARVACGVLVAGLSPVVVGAQVAPAEWIWYPGDRDIWLGNLVQARRVERTAILPPFWRMDSPYAMVVFTKKVSLATEEEVEVAAEGRYNVQIDGRYVQEDVQ